ncbi:RagB/SusD family nutrient uptake outer membrane protein [Sphingobacterium sp. UBA6645]|uniref:RagB/SusD family nutrient uptake outer membrane protein n=1 Tax=Sphingobacterium sp. UBA6645 TaxID=1947511 RepID=UPI0025EEC681|nr:RagB/SusD family nutrient uptake outer membrane protein [Sphingobacterium sp. UBA6645]
MKKNKITIKLVAVALSCMVAFSGCRKYLEVYPKSSVSEDQIFLSEIGFQQALTGVYSQLAAQRLYGDNLTMGFVSALAQNYNPQNSNSYFYATSAYNYTSDEVLGYASSTWNTAYNAIAAANNIISHTETNRSVLTDENYNLIRGEALALRALLHFDVLRLFAPSMTVGANTKAIPYKTSVDQYSKIPSTVSQVIDSALYDLQEAEVLLKKSDAILSGTINRQIKMNYYAVKALQARVYLYKGDKENAYAAAKIVMEADKFPFVQSNDINTIYGFNYLFKSELVFGLRVRDIQDWAVDLYFGSYRSDRGVPNRSLAEYQTLYEITGGGDTDYRYSYLLDNPDDAPATVYVTTKYWQTWTQSSDSSRLDQLVPVIRMTEMCYILAETAPTLTESLTWLNKVRGGRNLAHLSTNTLTEAYIRQELTKEYQKEFYAEGQLFFYYKRLNNSNIQFLSTTFDTSKYIIPIPDDELEANPNY